MTDPIEAFDALFRHTLEERDSQAALARWTTDPDVVMWGSEEDERAHGPEELKALLEAICNSPSEIRFDWEEKECHVEADVAWINARGTAYVNGEDSPYRITAVLIRRDDAWRWHTYSGSIPD